MYNKAKVKDFFGFYERFNMKKQTKILISVGLVVLIAAVIIAVSFISGGENQKEESSSTLAYELQSTTRPTVPFNTEAWVDLNQIASDLATSTDTTVAPSETLVPPVVSSSNQDVLTTIIYVYNTYPESSETTPVVTDPVIPVPTTDSGIIETAFGDNVQMQDYEYTIDSASGTVTLNKYLGSDSTVLIPKEIGGYKVTTIGDGCFENSTLKNLYAPKEITSVGNNAFKNCESLSAVVFVGPANLGNSAFNGCKSLSTVNLKSGTESIGELCFANCSSLTGILIPSTVNYIGQNAFSNCNSNLVISCVAGSHADETARKYEIKVQYVTE